MSQLSVTFRPNGETVSLATQTTVLEAAVAAGLILHTPCGGHGRCGKCMVRGISGLGEVTAAERLVFSKEELAEGWRLACQALVIGAAEVGVPTSSLVVKHQIALEGIRREILVEPNIKKTSLRLPIPTIADPRADLKRVMDALGDGIKPPNSLLALRQLPSILQASDYRVTAVLAGDTVTAFEAGDTSEEAYGVAVDIGTTTVVAYLCHLPTGRVLSAAADLNPQAHHGDDVISRLQLAISGRDGLNKLNEAVVDVINRLIAQAAGDAGVGRDHIYEVSIVGNTCMLHLFLGLSPIGMASLPFAPVFKFGLTVRADDVGLKIHPDGQVYVVPTIGGFVGADTIGVILASEIDKVQGIQVAVDIGTNGEIVVSRNGELFASSTAAGPAFEGAKISQGMRAVTGAIDEVSINHEVNYHVIGDVPPIGICGSGLVDVVAELLKVGLIEESGRLRRAEEIKNAPEKVRRRLIENDSGVEFVLSSAEDSGTGKAVTITARDIRETQLAKGAIYAGIILLLEELDLTPQAIESLLLAGAFGNYIRRDSAIAIGLIPALSEESIRSIGNAAGVGARLVLASVSMRQRAEEIARRVHHLELAEQEGFYDRFAEAMALRPMP